MRIVTQTIIPRGEDMANKEKDREALLDELVDDLVDDGKRAEDLLGENGILKQLTKRVLERMLEDEMADHLGYEKGDPAGRGSGNSRNGKTCKKVKTDQNEVTLAVPPACCRQAGPQRRF